VLALALAKEFTLACNSNIYNCRVLKP